MTRPDKMIRYLRRIRDLLTEEMSESEEHAGLVMELASHYGVEPCATGDIMPRATHGNFVGYYPVFSTDELDMLLAFAGALRAHANRPEPAEPPTPPPWEGM